MTTVQISVPGRRQFRQVEIDAAGLAAELRRRIDGEVRFDDASRGLYATDASNYRQPPIGVVVPRTIEDVVQTIELCREHGAPVLGRGGGTSLGGQCCNLAVVLDFSKYLHRVLQIDPQRRLARVQAGTILDDLRHAALEHGLNFGPDPATHNHCTLGGMIGNNSCGPHSVLAGKTVDNVEALEILTYDGLRLRVGPTSETELEQIIAGGGRRGEIYRGLKQLRDRYAEQIRERFPDIPRRVSGYNLPQLLPENGFHVARALVGSESTCVTVLQADLRLIPWPAHRVLMVVGYPDVYQAGDHVSAILELGPIAVEGLDDRLLHFLHKKKMHPQAVKLLPEGGGWLMVEFGGESEEEARDKAEAAERAVRGDGSGLHTAVFTDPDQQEMVWNVRESGLGATAYVEGMADTWPGWEDAAVAPDRVGDYLRDFRQLLDKHGYACSLYGHFGQGCIHTRIDFDLKTQQGLETYRRFLDEASDLVLRYGGSFSGEHGDGQARGELLPKMYGDQLMQAFREFKAIWDPSGRMNPGKGVDAYPVDENLRMGPEYRPLPVSTHFRFPEDGGDFAHAAARCVGVGKCRRMSGGTMCPSYMVTREEKHSTRGRARMLFEMLEGDPVRGGWADEGVKEALDLCLSCKGCKSECPVSVDMATYKAEFLSHYYQHHPRPRHAYAMGWIFRWARLASLTPHLVNWVGRAPLLGGLVKRIGGIAPQRQLPQFAGQTFRSWFESRPPQNLNRAAVMLWPDCFNNYFHPEVGRAAVEVLEAAGFRVILPPRRLCCGRPLYDFGMLDTARHLLQETLDVLAPQIQAGVPVVGLEPSCVAVFRDELPNLLPYDRHAQRLSQQAFLLSEFLSGHADDYRPPQLRRRAIVHQHCHHRAVLETDPERQLLERMGLDFQVLDSGCCGMAGSFGFEAEKYEVSLAVGERVLLPAVREADPETLIVADGFSCREQIAQLTGRRGLHVAEVLQMALREGPAGGPETFPEDYPQQLTRRDRPPLPALEKALLIGLGAAAAAGLAYGLNRLRR